MWEFKKEGENEGQLLKTKRLILMKFAPIIRIGQVPESKRQRGDLSANVMRKTGRGISN